MEFYRYVWTEYAGHDIDGELCSPSFPNPSLELTTYNLIKETPKGYWIGIGRIKYKWISKDSKKKYAYLTKEEALNNFIKRTEKRVKILKWQIDCSKIALEMAKNWDKK